MVKCEAGSWWVFFQIDENMREGIGFASEEEAVGWEKKALKTTVRIIEYDRGTNRRQALEG